MADFNRLEELAGDIGVLFELIAEDGETPELMAELTKTAADFSAKVEALETQSLLSGPYDTHAGIFSLNAGAGGTDAQDWAQILLRMYLRWFEQKGYTATVVDETLGEEAGLKSATVIVEGEYAYGFLKNEIGVHRLVRLSPFNANSKRQTSFAAVDVIPKIDADFSGIEIDPKDLRVDTYRSTGAGGQHVNKTDSAVRITHLPTGIVVQCQSERSQISNRDTAMGMLKSRLLLRMEEEHKQKISDIRGESKDIAWGNQIRSYVFHPYKLIKDIRTGVERTDIQTVMDGDLDGFIAANLRLKLAPSD